MNWLEAQKNHIAALRAEITRTKAELRMHVEENHALRKQMAENEAALSAVRVAARGNP